VTPIIKNEYKERMRALVEEEKCTHAAEINRGFWTIR